MIQKRLTESPEKTKQQIAHCESRPDSARSSQGGLHPILQLQRTLGNRNVAQLIQAKRLTPEGKIIDFQQKLTVGAVDDQYEQEADRVARQVMNTPNAVASHSVQRAISSEEDKDQMLQTKPLAASITPFVQRQMENNEESEDKEMPIQAKFLAGTSREPLQRQPETEEEETEPIQAKSAGALTDSFEAGADVETQVSLSKGRGSPLPDSMRAYMEPRFGADFSAVRVHTGSDARQMNQAVGAQAFTHGQDIFFDEGKFQPGTVEGDKLLAHELTHTIQQGGNGGVGADGVRRAPAEMDGARPTISQPSDSYEREAGAVADALTRGGDIAGLLDSGSGPGCPSLQRDTPQGSSPSSTQPATAPPPPPRPLDYDRRPKDVKPVPLGQTTASVTTLLNDKVRRGEITRFAVTGVQRGSHAEIFLLALLYGMAEKTRWSTEADIVTAIDWPAKPGDPPPQGRVTVRIDFQGAASAELIAAGPVPAVAQTTVAAGSAQLIADFGFATVTGWSGQNPTKDAAEISDVLAALELLKRRAPQDIPALKGVELIRVPSLSGTRAGEFFAGSQVSLGATADSKPWLKLADLVFDSDKVQFFGGGPGSPTVPASFETILHEVGHAVEMEKLRLAREEYDKASAELEEARKLVRGNPATYEAELQEAKRKGKLSEFYKKQEATYKKNVKAEDKAIKHQQEEASKLENTRVAASTIQPLEAEAAAQSTSAANSLTAAKGAVQALRPDEIRSSAAYVKAIDDTAAAITSFGVAAKAGQGVIDDLELVVFQKAGDRDKAHFELLRVRTANEHTHRAIFPLDRAVEAQDAWFEAERVLARARGRTRRLQKFIDLVTANNIRRFTQYSVENWQLKPEEFYAEAYSLWLVDPEFVKTNYKVVYDFFQSGDYRR